MKVRAHNKQIRNTIFYAADSDGSDEEDDTILRLKANKSKVGRLFDKARKRHDAIERNLHDAEMGFNNAGSAMHALGITKISDDIANRRAELQRHIDEELDKKMAMRKVGQKMLGYHRSHLVTKDGGGADGPETEAGGEAREELSISPPGKIRPRALKVMQKKLAAAEDQLADLRAMVEHLKAKLSQADLNKQTMTEDYNKLVSEKRLLQQTYTEEKLKTEKLEKQLLEYLDKDEDPEGKKEEARVPPATSEVAQAICALYEFIRTHNLRLRDVFQGMDRNQNGSVDKGEFVEALMSLNVGFTSWSCEAIFEQADIDHSGTIDYPEFLQGFRAGVDAFGKDQGVMFTLTDMKNAKEQLSKKKDVVIQKYKLKWERAEKQLTELKEELLRQKAKQMNGHWRNPSVDSTTSDEKSVSSVKASAQKATKPSISGSSSSTTTTSSNNSNNRTSKRLVTTKTKASGTARKVASKKASSKAATTSTTTQSTAKTKTTKTNVTTTANSVLSSSATTTSKTARPAETKSVTKQGTNGKVKITRTKKRVSATKKTVASQRLPPTTNSTTTTAASASASASASAKTSSTGAAATGTTTPTAAAATTKVPTIKEQSLDNTFIETKTPILDRRMIASPQQEMQQQMRWQQQKQAQRQASPPDKLEGVDKSHDPRQFRSAETKQQQQERWEQQQKRRADEEQWEASQQHLEQERRQQLAVAAGQQAPGEVEQLESIMQVAPVGRGGSKSGTTMPNVNKGRVSRPASAPVVAKAGNRRSVNGASTANVSYAKNHLQMLQRQSMELREKDQLITKLYRDIDSKTMAKNVAEQKMRESVVTVTDLLKKLEIKEHQLTELHEEFQTTLRTHAAELSAADDAVRRLEEALVETESDIAVRDAAISRLQQSIKGVSKATTSSLANQGLLFPTSTPTSPTAAKTSASGVNITNLRLSSRPSTPEPGSRSHSPTHSRTSTPKNGSRVSSAKGSPETMTVTVNTGQVLTSTQEAPGPHQATHTVASTATAGELNDVEPVAEFRGSASSRTLVAAPVDNEDLLRLVHKMLVDIERLWRSSSRLLSGDGSGPNGLSDANGGRGQIRVQMSRLSSQAVTMKKAIESRIPAMQFEVGSAKKQENPPQLNAPWRWREKAKFKHKNKKWLRPGFGTKQ